MGRCETWGLTSDREMEDGFEGRVVGEGEGRESAEVGIGESKDGDVYM